MINEIRTFILNQSWSSRPTLGTYGEEYLPTTYVPKFTGFESLRRALFSNSSDPLFQNCRLSQFIEVLYSCDKIQDYLASFDTRRVELCNMYTIAWGRNCTKGVGVPVTASLDIIGDNPQLDGKSIWQWDLQYVDSDIISVALVGGSYVDLTMNFTDGLSDILTFPNQSSLKFRLRYPGSLPTPASPAWTFRQQVLQRPTSDVAGLVTNIMNSPALYSDLFQLPQEMDLVKLWSSPQVFQQLSAILMGLILRTQEA